MPSGPTLMSQPEISAAVAGRPRFGVSTVVAAAQPTATNAIAPHTRSRIDMLHLAAGRHAPGLDRVAVEDGVVAVLRDELLALGLPGTGVVGGARLQHGGAAVPSPGHAKACERAGQHRRAERRVHPGPSAMALALGMLRLMAAAAAPRARIHEPPRSTPASSRRSRSGTPVHSVHETRPCVWPAVRVGGVGW